MFVVIGHVGIEILTHMLSGLKLMALNPREAGSYRLYRAYHDFLGEINEIAQSVVSTGADSARPWR